jgi:protein TonB
MALAAAAGGWQRGSADAPIGLLTSIVLHGAAIALAIAGLHGGMSGEPAERARQAAFVSLVPGLPVAEPEPQPVPRWGLRAAAPETSPMPEAPDPLMEKTPLPEVASAMASLPLATFVPRPAEEDAVAIAPARPVPPPASVKLRKAASLPQAAEKSKPKPAAKPASRPVATAPAGETTAQPQPVAAAAAPRAATPSSTQGSAPAARAPAAVSDAPVLVTNPNYAGACPIRYPERARRRNQEGTVLIHALIDAQGKPIEVTVVSSSGHSLLDQAARDAIADCAFVPQRVGGRAVKAIVEIPIPFKLI